MSEHAEHIARLIAELPPPSEAEKAYLRKALAPAIAVVNARKAATVQPPTAVTRRAA